MANREKLVTLPADFLKTVEALLKTAPPMKSAKDRKTVADARKVIARAKRRGTVEPAKGGAVLKQRALRVAEAEGAKKKGAKKR